MGQYFGASMRFGVMDLLRHCCDEHRVDVLALLHRVYPGEGPTTLADLQEIREQATWEGIVYPPHWSMALSRELTRALLEVGYARLADFLGRAMMGPR